MIGAIDPQTHFPAARRAGARTALPLGAARRPAGVTSDPTT